MTKFVLATHCDRLVLNEKHLTWLHSHGYPEADEYFCCDDRSNPALVACVEAVHESMNHLVEQALSMLKREEELSKAAECDTARMSNAIHNFVATVKAAGVKCHKNLIITTLVRASENNASWAEACRHFNRVFGITIDTQKEYEKYLKRKNAPAILAAQEAHQELEHFCAANGLSRYFQTFTIDDGYVVKTFDETRFTAKAVPCDSYEYEGDYGSSWETLELTPYLSRDTINSFVAKGDTDGLMEYLRSLKSNISIEG